MKLYLDSETCGLHGLIVIIQYAWDDEPVKIYCPWTEPVQRTLDLIELFMCHDLIGFNLAFDHFHLCKLYTIFSLVEDKTFPPSIKEIFELEPLGRDGPCLKPKRACDLMLIARRGKYQALMDRKDVRIRKVPIEIAHQLQEVLDQESKLDDIYFAKRKNRLAPKWKVFDRDDNPRLKDVVLKFHASTSLKTLVNYALGKKVIKYDEATSGLESGAYPEECGYAPFAKALPRKSKTWKDLIRRHIAYWLDNPIARRYAEDDVLHTRDLYKHLGNPEPGDTDSELACMVAAVRWKGYTVDLEGIARLRDQALEVSQSAPKAPNNVKTYLKEKMDPLEAAIIERSTKRIVLEEIAESPEWEGTEAQKRARKVLAARKAKSELDLYNKLLTAGRFHASFNVIGALSGRMSGSDDLNPQGIKRARHVRENFTLSTPGMLLCGGDFISFEVALAAAVYPDPKLIEDLQSGKSIHAVFGTCVYPNMTYDEVRADKERYTRSKSAVFAMLYGGQAFTLMTRLGVSQQDAENAYQRFAILYPGVAKGREDIFRRFCSMRQEGGVGSKVDWVEPDDYVETMLGFRRYFTLENNICKMLYSLANNPPKVLKKDTYAKQEVVRTIGRKQTVLGATQTALYAAAFALQAANMRAAGNHVIQSTGAEITKHVQRAIWDLQPAGVSQWIVQPMNIHDEIMCPTHPDYVDKVTQVVTEVVDSYKDRIPLLGIDWRTGLKSWADK